MQLVNQVSMHLPVVSGRRTEDDRFDLTKAYVYGTAFPILPGVLATAAHVVRAAVADGEMSVVMWGGGGAMIKGFPLDGYEVSDNLDFALLYCSPLSRFPVFPMSFRRLDGGAVATTVGYPFAVDAEWVNVVPRAFKGYVITRRELLHLQPLQPAGYELSFPTPPGTSGAPLLVNLGAGDYACNGWIIQQQRIGSADDGMVVGLAVCSTALLSIRTSQLGHLAHQFKREVVPLRPPTPAQRPGGIHQLDVEIANWPDDDLPFTEDAPVISGESE